MLDYKKALENQIQLQLTTGDVATDAFVTAVIDALNKYGDALEELKNRGIPESLLGEVISMDIDNATLYMEKLLSLTDEKYDSYMELWNTKQKTAEDIAQRFYKQEFDNLSKQYIDKLPAELSDLKNEMTQLGKYSAQGLGDGFQSEFGYIKDKMVSTLQSAYAAAKEALDVHSPSKLYAKLGSFMGQGIGVGFVDGMKTSMNTMTELLENSVDDLRSVTELGMPTVSRQITAQNFYNTKNYQATTEVIRQPQDVTIQLDKYVLGKAMVPVLDREKTILGGNLA